MNDLSIQHSAVSIHDTEASSVVQKYSDFPPCRQDDVNQTVTSERFEVGRARSSVSQGMAVKQAPDMRRRERTYERVDTPRLDLEVGDGICGDIRKNFDVADAKTERPPLGDDNAADFAGCRCGCVATQLSQQSNRKANRFRRLRLGPQRLPPSSRTSQCPRPFLILSCPLSSRPLQYSFWALRKSSRPSSPSIAPCSP